MDALLGPRLDANAVRVKIGTQADTAELGAVSVSGETLARLEAEAERLTRQTVRQVARGMVNRGAGSLGGYAGRGYGR